MKRRREAERVFEERLRAAAGHVASLGYAPVYVSLHGSQNYGLDLHTDDYQSDFDFKCIALPSLWDLVSGKRPASLTVETGEGKIDIKDIRVFCDALERMNPAYLESLATAHHLILPGGEGMQEIRTLLPALLRERASMFARACEGLFEDKAKRMCHDSPAVHERIARHGYDGKQPHHMYRLLMMLREFERSGEMNLSAPQEERALLMGLKKNEFALDEVQAMIPGWRAEMHALCRKTEQKYGAPGRDALEEIIRLSREMMAAHARKT